MQLGSLGTKVPQVLLYLLEAMLTQQSLVVKSNSASLVCTVILPSLGSHCFQGQALSSAAGMGFDDIVTLLLSKGANANSRDANVSDLHYMHWQASATEHTCIWLQHSAFGSYWHADVPAAKSHMHRFFALQCLSYESCLKVRSMSKQHMQSGPLCFAYPNGMMVCNPKTLSYMS